jgi:hypothetical protein
MCLLQHLPDEALDAGEFVFEERVRRADDAARGLRGWRDAFLADGLRDWHGGRRRGSGRLRVGSAEELRLWRRLRRRCFDCRLNGTLAEARAADIDVRRRCDLNELSGAPAEETALANSPRVKDDSASAQVSLDLGKRVGN